MARLQILELPEGSGDDRPPFVLVIDQYQPLRYVQGVDQEPEPVNEFAGVAEQIGARGVLVFQETVDIPANDVPVDPDGYPLKIRVEPDFEQFREQVQDEILDRRDAAMDAQRLVDERTEIARDMDRLAGHKAALLDALGMDHTRDWDDIRNAAAGVRKKSEDLAAKIERVLRIPEAPQQGVGAEAFDYLNGYRDATRAALSALVDPTDDQSPSDA